MEIRSYRRVFDLERRIYSVDRLRLNPAGLPLRGLVYFLTAVGASLLLGCAPGLELIVGRLPWYLRDLVLPAAVASLLTVVRIDGRAFHLAAMSAFRLAIGPRRVSRLAGASRVGERWRPPELLSLPDGSEARLRRLRYTGPGAVLVLVAHDRIGAEKRGGRSATRGAAVVTIRARNVRQRPARGEVLCLERGARLEVERSVSQGR